MYTPGLSENRGGTSRYFDFDQIGNLWTVDGSGKSQLNYEDVSGFGALTAGSKDVTPYQFGGGNGCQTDADTGLVLMGHRYYDTRIGRFISQDPMGAGDNWYAYAGNNPVNNTDPFGLDTCPAGLDQQSWDRCADERAENDAEQEDYLSNKYPDATIQHDIYGSPFVQVGSMTITACSDGNNDSNAGTTQAIDNMLTGGMDTKAVQSAKAGNYVAAGAYFAAGVGMVYMTLQGGEGRAGAEVAQVTANRLAGDAFRDEIASQLEKAGFSVEKEVVKPTIFGPRRIDIEVSKDGNVLGGIETKWGGARYHSSQRSKDWYLRKIKGYQVNVVRGP